MVAPKSVFARYTPKAYPYMWKGKLFVSRIAGGIPTDPKVAEGWIKTKLGTSTDALLQAQVAEVMAARGVGRDVAVEVVNTDRHLNGFKRDREGCLYIEGRQLKAAIKEAANVRWPRERWGPTNKGTMAYFAEHFFVQEDRIYLQVLDDNGALISVKEPSEVNQRFVHTWRGTGIQYEEVVHDTYLQFTLATDVDMPAEKWALLWLTGEMQGIGATRSQGYGRYLVVEWDKA